MKDAFQQRGRDAAAAKGLERRKAKKWGGHVRIKKVTFGNEVIRFHVEVKNGTGWTHASESYDLAKAIEKAEEAYVQIITKSEIVEE